MNLKKEYQKQINKVQNNTNNEEFYKHKMSILYDQMEEIYKKEHLDARTKADKILELVQTFENYAEKSEKHKSKIEELEVKFINELDAIANMIKQSKPKLSKTNINDLIQEYINTNSDTYN